MPRRPPFTALACLLVAALAVAACSPAPSGPASTAGGSPAATPSGSGPGDAAAVGRAFVEALARGDSAAAEAMEDETMRAAAPAAELDGIWQQLVAQFGEFRALGETTTQDQPPYTVATVEGTFADAVVPLLVIVDADGRAAASDVPAYVDPDAFTESEVTVGEDPWALPGTLTMPVGDGPFPAVVLVAGSGPNDRDETIGPNKPLRDLAWGLASDGIAVLRYDKRTKVHGAAMAADAATVTVHEEVVEDALAAVELLRTTPAVDAGRVHLVGHSLGGYLAPRIAEEGSGRLAGIGLLAANSSPMPELVVAQYEYLASDEGGADPQARAALPEIREQAARALSPDLSPATPATDLPLGVPAAYWIDLRSYDPVATARELAMPTFLGQGGRDHQVPPSELEAWREALAGRSDVTIREYPDLNHLFLAGSGSSRPAEYAVPGHVAEEVVRDLATWVRATG